MKQKQLLTKSLLLLAVMLMGAGTAWAEEVTGTITFGTNNVKINAASVTGDDDQDNTWTITTVGTTSFTQQPTYSQVGSSSKPATSITFTTTLSDDVNITAMSAKFGGFNGTAGTVTLTVDNTTVGTGSLNASNDVTVSSISGATGKTLTVTLTDIAKGVKCYYISYTYTTGGGSQTPTCATPTFSPAGGTYSSAQNVTISTTTEDATVYYTTDGTDPTTSSNVYSAAIPVSTTTTIKAIAVADGYENSVIATANYSFITLEHAGTEADPYTVADARTAIDANVGVTGVYATGKVSKIVTAYNSTYGNISFNISVDGTEDADQLEAYRCFGSDDYSAEDVWVGATVIIYGDLQKYNSTYEFGQGCQIVYLESSAVPAIKAENVKLTYDATSGEIAYTIDNPVEGKSLTATTEANWISNIIVGTDKVTFTTTANEGNEDRTATITLSYEGAGNKVVTVTQGHFVADYATLPFEFDGGKADIENTEGLTQEGLGSDYNSSPKLKFDGTGDYVILKINETPGKLTFDIKGNSFSGGTFTVQTSVDGVTYTDLEAYTDLSTALSEEFDDLDENVRYIKWIYTEKVNGNVALGNITLAKPSTAPVINIDRTEVEVTADKAEGTIDLTYANIEISDMTDFGIQYYDAEGEETSEPDWIEVLVAEQDPQIGEGYVVSYVIEANEGEARSAYFKVFATGDEDFVYSNLVTVTQAAPATGDEYALFTGDLVEGDYVIYYDGKAMNTTVSNDRLQYAEVNPVNNVITTDNVAIVWHIAQSGNYWTIYNDEADAYAAGTGVKNKAQLLENGTDDMALWTVTGIETYEFVNKKNEANEVNANLRNNGTYGFACYATGTGGALSLYKKVVKESITISAAGYRTYCSENALDFSTVEGLTAYKATIDENKVSFETVEQVPAGQGVLLKGAQGTYKVPVIASTTADFTDNEFVGVTEQTTVNKKGIYVLLNGTAGVGFYKTTAESFTVGANTAYIDAIAGARNFIAIDEATSIEDIAAETMTNGEVYNLQGQRVVKAQKGLYIINGKKVVIK